jgi:hypothetical protein
LGSVRCTFFARLSPFFKNLFDLKGSDAWTNFAPILSSDLLLGFNGYGATFDVVDSSMSPHSWTYLAQLEIYLLVPRLAHKPALESASSRTTRSASTRRTT